MVKNVLEYLEQTEQKYGRKTAVEDGSTSLTYHQLLECSRKIGSALAESVPYQKPVVIFMEKSCLTLASMLGTVYAGCFYVCVNPEQPPKRIGKIFEVLKPAAVLAIDKHREVLEEAGYEGCWLDPEKLVKGRIHHRLLQKIRRATGEKDLLYGMFTSGSTGVPKGITVSHRAVIDFIGHFTELFEISGEDRIGNQAPFDFDVSVKDIYSSLKTGATLVLIPKEMFVMPSMLIDYLCEKRVTTLIWAVSALCVVSGLKGLEYRVPETVKRVLFSGECMPAKQLRIWQRALPGAIFVNLYGPSEITCNCTWYKVEREFSDEERIPIGRPFPGRSVFLLDEKGEKILGTGKPGEICVSGESLAKGYYRDKKQTEERFVQCPADGSLGRRIYRTGDLGYYGSERLLYFCGRKDFQIKHMGHRIELEEIEHAISGIEGVSRGYCVYDPEKCCIMAYYVGKVGEAWVHGELKKRVPAYMLPSRLIQLEQMPVNKNGKTDRNALRQSRCTKDKEECEERAGESIK